MRDRSIPIVRSARCKYLLLMAGSLVLIGMLTGIGWIVEIEDHRIAPQGVRSERSCPLPLRDLRRQDRLIQVELTQYTRPVRS